MEDHLEKTTVYVNMLGGFSITIGDKCVADCNNQARKPWELLEYLITFRSKEIPPSELVDLFWGEDSSANPVNALKTLMFRSRKLLTPLGYPVHDLIVQRHGSYSWTSELDTVVDTDTFEFLCNRAEDNNISEEERLALCIKALSIYRGDFLPKSAWEPWAVPISAFYHSIYQNLAHKTLDLLLPREDYPVIIDVCQRAIRIDPFDETFHYDLILAMFKSGDQNGALEHYNRTIEMFYNEFTITPSERMKELYKMISDKRHGIIEDLTILQESLAENSSAKNGAFYCEPSVFKDIYQLESRSIGRTGDSIYLCLLTLSSDGKVLPKPTFLGRAMEAIDSAIRSSLRRGDVYTRYSISQYMILLPTASYENGERVLKRIIHNYKKLYTRRDITVTYTLQSVFPN